MKISTTINRMVDKPDSAVRAFASVTLDDCFAIHGLRVIKSRKGLFVNMPSNSYKDKEGNTQYSDIFHPITKSAREAVSESVLGAYRVALTQSQKAEVEITPDGNDESAEEYEQPEDDPGPVYSM
ncbi:MAG: SpoVG family protein [Ruminococcus sp.]|nr:SpoVG family protein [Ruminococcus sp.]